jgi:hypothetical protein
MVGAQLPQSNQMAIVVLCDEEREIDQAHRRAQVWVH